MSENYLLNEITYSFITSYMGGGWVEVYFKRINDFEKELDNRIVQHPIQITYKGKGNIPVP